MRWIQKLLIANRGEIAVRVMKTCREMGIATVAVFSEADRQSLFVQLADEAVYIGPPPSSDSYLNQEKIMEAIRKTGADAVHPGYGFLSENAEFAARCLEEGVIFIGPSPQTMRIMSSKIEARHLVASLGLPVIPGYDGTSVEGFSQEADRIGYPLLLKASAGGGGIGMRIVEDPTQLTEAITSARLEAANAFGDDQLFLEKYLTDIRHIEFQVLGDGQGNVVHCGERECSIQRRRQKIIEETPSPFLTAELREKMGDTAVAIAKAVDYSGAGTVEFVVESPSGKTMGTNTPFYFLEMNTRLQVEHGITEMVTGLDLVRLQIQVAEGNSLQLRQEEIQMQGYALESRLYAEDPENHFHPASGHLLKWQPPSGPNLRMDSGVQSNAEISIFYDPLLAKIMTFGASRKEAIRLMNHTLEETIALGIITNQPFLQQVFRSPAFLEGQTTTNFVETQFPPGKRVLMHREKDREVLLTVSVLWLELHKNQEAPTGEWRGGFQTPRLEKLLIGSKQYDVAYFIRGKGQFDLMIGEHPLRAKLFSEQPFFDLATGRVLKIEINEVLHTFHVVQKNETVYVHSKGLGNVSIRHVPHFQPHQESQNENHYQAQMPAKILEIRVVPGEIVEAGQKLLVMESMKMENSVVASTSGKIMKIFVEKDQLVEARTPLLELEPSKDNQ